MSANLHVNATFRAVLDAFAPPVATPVEHLTRVERCEGEGAYGYEARCLCGWSTGGLHTLRQIENLADDHCTHGEVPE